MLYYLAAPYTRVDDREALMRDVMRFSGELMVKNPGHHVVSPLFNHYSLNHVPALGVDYNFWKSYSQDLLKRCDALIVLTYDGWLDSTGVTDEINFARSLGLVVRFAAPSELDHWKLTLSTGE
jgi:hypothetical protein